MKRMMLLCMLIGCMLFSTAQAESGTYGKTRTTLRVRSSASLTSAVLDNIIPDACIYMLDTAKSGSDTFAKVKYRAYSGSVVSGWVRIQEGSAVYVDELTDAQAKALFSVSGGSLPSARVGKFKTIGTSSSGSSSSSSGSSSASSNAVKQLQTHLKKLGYYYGEITGNIGTKTEAAIKAFQKAQGLSVTGKADSATLAAAEKAANGTSSGSSSASSDAVKQLQENLKKLGYYYGEITGNIGTKTEAAIKAFQKAQGLTVTGEADAATRTAAEKAANGTSSGSGSSATASQIEKLQEHLKALGYYYGEITGNIGTKTEAAIKAFQKAQGLTVTGDADAATRTAAEKAAGSSSSGSGSSATASQIKTLQENLKALGYYYGEITGNIGTKTEAAIKAFQKAKGLSVTGDADSATLSAAKSAAAALSSPVSEGKVYNVDWFANKSGFYKKVGITPGGQARLTDLLTGRSLNIYILYSGNHADVEPLTADDTETLCKIYGVSSPEKISYVRRPMLVTVGGFRIVCSIYGVPHGDQKITTNNFDGQFCLHFSGSKTHGTSSVDADHQAAISRAATIMQNKGYTIVTKAPSL